ncbi:response regulator [Flaviaesturariibacter amylovorans]|uniref:Response regulatory domain-containing protein n=1 Tax=Flaviaesturariibacter amylovorans TaxID=1084520 RepID=A0ABP8HTY1_9BACT
MPPAKLVLYADDDEDDRLCFQEAWNSYADYELKIFESAIGLLEFMQQNPSLDLCVVVLDQNMPQLSGIEALERVRTMNPYEETPVVLYSTNIYGGQLSRAASVYGAHLVQKSNTLAEIRTDVERIIGLCDPPL